MPISPPAPAFVAQGFQQVVTGGGDHGGNRDQEGEFERGGARHAGGLSGGDGGHGTRGAGENRGEDLAGADPDGLRQGHLINALRPVARGGGAEGARAARVGGNDARRAVHGIHDPHDDAADDQGSRHDVEAFEILADDMSQQVSRTGGHDEGDASQSEGMVPQVVAAVRTLGKSLDEFLEAGAEVDGQAKNGAELDDDGVHLPVAAGEVEPQALSTMRRCAVELTGRNSVRPSTMPRRMESR